MGSGSLSRALLPSPLPPIAQHVERDVVYTLHVSRRPRVGSDHAQQDIWRRSWILVYLSYRPRALWCLTVILLLGWSSNHGCFLRNGRLWAANSAQTALSASRLNCEGLYLYSTDIANIDE
jgi:hypothetical protein